MRRERLELELDSLFAEKLTSPKFLRQTERDVKKARPQVNNERIEAQIQSLVGKRQRILDSYFEGVINPTERDLRLAEIERERKLAGELLNRQRVHVGAEAKVLAKVFSTFLRFKKLSGGEKRRMLTAIAPEILVADYSVKGLYLPSEALSVSSGVSPTATGFLGPERIYVQIAA
jgi:hypothetical protein